MSYAIYGLPRKYGTMPYGLLGRPTPVPTIDAQPFDARPKFTQAGYTRLWGLTDRTTGAISGSISVDTGDYDVKWWDNTVSNYTSGDTFSKLAAGGLRAFELYPVQRRFKEASSNGFEVIKNGYAVISTAQSKFGGKSFLFSNNTSNGAQVNPRSYLAIETNNAAPNAALSVGTGDFTVECWVRFIALPPTGYTYSYTGFAQSTTHPTTANVNKWWFGYNAAGGGRLQFNTHEITNTAFCTWNPVVNQWYHLAYVRQSGTSKLFIDGVSQTVTNPTAHNGRDFDNAGLAIGLVSTPTYFNGYIDDFRLVKGTAVYTGTFTPPSAPLTAISGTSVLINCENDYYSVPTGQFDGFDVSSNDLVNLRAELLSLGLAPGYFQWVPTWIGYPYYYYQYNQVYVPGPAEVGKLNNNKLSAAALDQFYTDLSLGEGNLFVQGNPGIVSDTPAIATAKDYTVFGSVPPATSLLLNFNGTNGGTTFTDSSVNGFTVTKTGTVTTSTTQSKFGGSSGYFDGGYLDIAANSANVIAVEDFTAECWIYPTQSVATGGLISIDQYTNGLLLRWGTSTDQLYVNNIYQAYSPTTHAPLNTWTHIAAVRYNGTVKFYVAGVERASFTSAGWGGTSGVVRIGASGHNVNEVFRGYIDDVRITRGLAIYTTNNFTPPTAQLAPL